MKKLLLFTSAILFVHLSHGQKVFQTNSEILTVRINNKIVTSTWSIDKTLNPDVLEVECRHNKNSVTFSDGKDSINFSINKNQNIYFIILHNEVDSAHTRISGIEQNVNFTKKYIQKNNGKTSVQIAEVSELVNVIMALHEDAEKESNMFDTKTAYYQHAKEYFKPDLNHPIFDTVQKYITDLYYNEEHDLHLFSEKSYMYYFEMKMNACAYEFDRKGKIKNKGIVKRIAKDWNYFDPMKDVALLEDFAVKSNFRKFYQVNKPYYDSLISIYKQLNPIQEMQNWLDKKFGFGYGSYAIYFSPLIKGAHSTTGLEDENFSQTLMFICRAEMDLDYPPIINELLESRVVFTEIDHNYVNPVSNKYLDEINTSFSNREKWAKGDITSTYNNPYMVFNEYMTFAVYSLYVFDNYSKEDLSEYLPMLEVQMTEYRGFIKFDEFNKVLLEKYKQNPNIKMTDLYDYILNWAAEINKG